MRLTHKPAKGNMNQGYGPRPKPTPTSPATHYGQDYGWGGGDAIYAAAPGRVKSVATAGAYGFRVVIDHGDGFETWYCHLSAANVTVGGQVTGGQRIATMGATGNVTAKHLHFEVRKGGVAVDPAPYFTITSSTTTTPIGDPGVTSQDIINTRGNDGRNVLDGVIETRSTVERAAARQEAINERAERRHADVLAAAKRQEEINQRAERRHAEVVGLLTALTKDRP